jgi:hypothetical protein
LSRFGQVGFLAHVFVRPIPDGASDRSVHRPPEALDRYRLDAPDYEVVFQAEDRTESLPFGVLPPSATDEWDAQWVYSKRPDEPAILAIDRYFVTLVRQQMLDLMPLPASATEERKTE